MVTGPVKLIRLVTGEDLIAEIVPSQAMSISLSRTVELKNPIRIVVIPDPANKNQPKVGFAPFVEFAKSETIEIDRNHILFETEPNSQFVEHYKATFSKVIMPSTSIVIPKG